MSDHVADFKMAISKPDDVDVSLTITMTLRSWRKFERQLGTMGDAPTWWVAKAVSRLVDHVNITSHHTVEYDPFNGDKIERPTESEEPKDG